MQADPPAQSRREQLTEMFNAINEMQGLPPQQSFTPVHVMSAALLVSTVRDRIDGGDGHRKQCEQLIGQLLDAECGSPEEARQMKAVIDDGADRLPIAEIDPDHCRDIHRLLVEEVEAVREEMQALRRELPP